jgi:hypothetical protein
MVALLAWGIGYAVATLRRAQELEQVGAFAGMVALIPLGALILVLAGGILLARRWASIGAVLLYAVAGLAALGRVIHEATQTRLARSVGEFAPPVIVLCGSAAILGLLLARQRAR